MDKQYYIATSVPMFILLALFFMIIGASIVTIVYVLEAGKQRRKHINETRDLQAEIEHLRLTLNLKTMQK